MAAKIRVLFLQTRSYPWSYTTVHALLMRHFHRERVEVHVAYNPGSRSEPGTVLSVLEAIPDLHLRQAYFGPKVFDKSIKEITKAMLISGPRSVVSPLGLVSYIKKNQIEIIHASHEPRDAAWGAVLARLSGVKYVVHLHAKCGDWMHPVVHWSMRHADGILGVSRYGAQAAVEYGYPSSKVHAVLNSVDASRWDGTADGRALREEFALAPDAPLLASIAVHTPWKGTDKLLKAIAMLKDRVPGIKLLIVGGGRLMDAAGQRTYIDVLKEMTLELGLSEQVIFTGHRSDIPQIMAACDVFAMPAFEEPFGLVFLEAMAMRKPVIGLESGGTPEIVEHGKAGLLAPAEDIPALAENILTLLTNAALRQQMGAYGRARVEQYFTPQRSADDVEDIYRKVLGKALPELPPA
ncbi:MAG TPA: glycosyltransferase family 4 protein [Ktedonobacterales bacterium]|jgi:glycosyltransferase involved in cell wall biosynthesis